MGTVGISAPHLAHLRSRGWPAFLAMLAVLALGLAEADMALPHPLGDPVTPPAHLGAFLPAVFTAAAAALLHSRWRPDYERSVTARAVIVDRVILLAVFIALALLGGTVFRPRATDPYLALMAAHLAITLGVLLLFVDRLGAGRALAVAALPGLLLPATGWMPGTWAFFGDAEGAGTSPVYFVVAAILGVIGCAGYLRGGSRPR